MNTGPDHAQAGEPEDAAAPAPASAAGHGAAHPGAFAPAAAAIGMALRRAQIAVMEDFNQALQPGDIRALHYAVLACIATRPDIRSSQISIDLRIKHTNLVPLLDELQGRGLIERRRVPSDRRARGLHLTADGAALMAMLLPKVAAHEARFAGRIGRDGSYVLIGLLARLADASFDAPGLNGPGYAAQDMRPA